MNKNAHLERIYHEKLESYLSALVDSNHITQKNAHKILDLADMAISNAKTQ